MEIEVDLNSKKTRRNKNRMIEVIKQDAEMFNYASKFLKDDYSFSLEAVKVNPKVYEKIHDKFKNDRLIILEAAKPGNDKFAMSYFPNFEMDEKHKDDFEIINKCIDVDGYNFLHASERLKNNKELVLKAIKNIQIPPGGNIIYHCGDTLNDNDVLIAAAKKDLTLKDSLPKEIFDNKNFVEEILMNFKYGHYESIDGESKYFHNLLYLKHKNSKFLNDRGLILKVLKKNKSGELLKFVDSKFKKDKEIVYAAIKNNGEAIIYADKKFINDRKLIFKSIKTGLESFLNPILKKYHKDEKFIYEAVKNNPANYKKINNSLKSNKKIALCAVENYGFLLEYVPKKLRADREIVLKAFSDRLEAIQFMDPKFRSDEDLIITCLKKLESKYRLLGEWKNIGGWDDFLWSYIDNKFKTKKSFLLETLKNNIVCTSDYEFIYNDPDLKEAMDKYQKKILPKKNLKLKINLKG